MLELAVALRRWDLRGLCFLHALVNLTAMRLRPARLHLDVMRTSLAVTLAARIFFCPSHTYAQESARVTPSTVAIGVGGLVSMHPPASTAPAAVPIWMEGLAAPCLASAPPR